MRRDTIRRIPGPEGGEPRPSAEAAPRPTDDLPPAPSRERAPSAEVARQAREELAQKPTLDRLYARMYDTLRREARRQMRWERPDHTLRPTELVNEAYLRLRHADPIQWSDEHHLLRTAARCMRRVLIDLAKGRLRKRRGGKAERVAYFSLPDETKVSIDDLIALERALDKLGSGPRNLPREREVLELHFFTGATMAEIGRALGISEVQARHDWRHARAWLKREIGW